MSKPKTVADYMKTLTPERREGLEKILRAIRTIVPKADEVISYGIPAFKLNGRVVIFAAAWKSHYSVYPITPAMMEEHAEEIASYETSKGTIRFPAGRPLPTAFVKRLAKTRAAELKAGGR